MKSRLTTVTLMPWSDRLCASLSMGKTWPCAGYGTRITCGFFLVAMEITVEMCLFLIAFSGCEVIE
ncbi:hypothetical protein LINPERHAP1_LOCUS20722 [Linum perenne]